MKIYFNVLMSFLILMTFAQSSLFGQIDVSTLQFDFNTESAPTTSLSFPRTAIENLSKQEATKEFSIIYDVEIKPEEAKERINYQIFFRLDEVTNSQYRGFSVADYLLPKKASFEVLFSNQKEQKKKNFESVEFDNTHTLRASVSFDKEDDYKPVLIENIKFEYDKVQEKVLLSRLQTIDDYYTESEKIDPLMQELRLIKSENNQEKAKVQLEPIKNTIDKLEAYAKQLITNDNDPASLNKSIRAFKNAYIQTRASVFPVDIGVCDKEYGKAVGQLDNGNESEAQISFNQILNKCPEHTPSLVRRAQLLYQEGEFDEARQDLSKLPKNIELVGDLKAIAEGVYYDLFSYFVRKGDYASRNLHFDEAFNYYSHAEAICTENPFLPNCTTEIAPRLTKAKNDKLEYLDAQVKSALYENNLKEAVSYISQIKEIATDNQIKVLHLDGHLQTLNRKLAKRVEDAKTIQNWEETISAIELKAQLNHTDSAAYWNYVQSYLRRENHKELLLYSTVRFAQIHLPTTNNLLKYLTQDEQISTNDWKRLGEDIGKKDYYLQPTAKAEKIIRRYVLLDPALNTYFQEGYFKVWQNLEE